MQLDSVLTHAKTLLEMGRLPPPNDKRTAVHPWLTKQCLKLQEICQSEQSDSLCFRAYRVCISFNKKSN